jgi:hypothetical protein
MTYEFILCVLLFGHLWIVGGACWAIRDAIQEQTRIMTINHNTLIIKDTRPPQGDTHA